MTKPRTLGGSQRDGLRGIRAFASRFGFPNRQLIDAVAHAAAKKALRSAERAGLSECKGEAEKNCRGILQIRGGWNEQHIDSGSASKKPIKDRGSQRMDRLGPRIL
jgi:hypothetical protein